MERPLYHNRDFMLLWSGQIVASLGSGVTRIVYPLLILALTNSPAQAGLCSALTMLPYLFFSLPAGALVDRWNRKRVMIICDIARALVLACIPLTMLFDALAVWQLYLATFVEGTFFVFFSLAEVAALPRVVDKMQIAAALAQNEAGFTTTHILSPSVGTWLYNTSQIFPFAFNAVSYLASAVSLCFLRIQLKSEPQEKRPLWKDVHEGLSWLWNHGLLRYMAFLTGGLSFVGGSSQLLVIVLAKKFGASEAEIGLLFSVSATGGIAGALIASRVPQYFRFSHIIILTSTLLTLLFPLYGFAPSLFWLTAINLIMQIVGPVYNIAQYSNRVQLIPDKLQGRVNAAYRMIAMGAFPLGSATVGVLIENFGTSVAILCFFFWQVCFALSAILSQQLKQSSLAPQPSTK